MANPFRDFFLGQLQPKRAELVEAIEPRRTFDDVIVPASTRRALDHALTQIQKHDLIFGQWGLGERHATGRGLAFNFAGPPGTGKTICAEAIAHVLGKQLMVVRYSEVESLWAGETGKNVSAMFRSASEQDAVLFFDEADAIASRRFSSVTQGFQREANTVVNVLLKELEEFDGVVIFATNLAANFDPAFERRIRTHILFEMPGPAERAQIWKVQLHARKTPLAEDVNFDELAEKYAVAGGEIKNAVLKAAQMASGEPGPDNEKKIHQRHFIAAMDEVFAARKVMEQTLFSDGDGSNAASLAGLGTEWNRLSRTQETLEGELSTLLERVAENERHVAALPGIVERFDDAARAAQLQMRAELLQHLEALAKQNVETSQSLGGLREGLSTLESNRNELQNKFETELQNLNQQIATEREGVLQSQREALAAWQTRWMIALALGVLAVVIAIATIVMR
jgi:AAA+ superfamily predicted ATPase